MLVVGARVPQHRAVEVAQFGIDGCQAGYGVPFAQDKHVLPAPGRLFDIEIDEAAVEERNQGDDGGEGAARVNAFVHRVAALLQGQDADIGILDREQLQDALAHRVRPLCRPVTGRRKACCLNCRLNAHVICLLRYANDRIPPTDVTSRSSPPRRAGSDQ